MRISFLNEHTVEKAFIPGDYNRNLGQGKQKKKKSEYFLDMEKASKPLINLVMSCHIERDPGVRSVLMSKAGSRAEQS